MAETRAEARLFVLAGPDLARSFPLGERSTLGRADECEVVLHDRSISRKHAEVVREGARWFVRDLGSTNGISKDGVRAERLELSDGDEFRLGDLPLRFKLTAAGEAQDIEFDLGPPASTAPAASKPAAPSPKPVARARSGPASATEADEIQLEEPDEIQLEGAPAGTGAPAPTAFRPPRAERRTGIFSGDFEQQPFWLRVVLVLVLLALAGGLALGAFQAVQMLRSGL